ncbi:hypothetical protein TNCV_271821 [Trichonephila clavipes]|nr:hypothetical protein TNCV_271821 [Trichonephila clavipes]
MILGVGPICIDRRQFGFRRSPTLLLTNTRPSLTLRQNLLSSENTTYLHSVLHSLCHCDTIYIRISVIDAVRCATAEHRIRWSFLSVVPHSRPEPGLREAIAFLDYCSQQSCTLYTFRREAPGEESLSTLHHGLKSRYSSPIIFKIIPNATEFSDAQQPMGAKAYCVYLRLPV